MVDAALAENGAAQPWVRLLPSRVVVYLMLAAGLVAEIRLCQAWTRLCAGLLGRARSAPAPSAVTAARAWIGVARCGRLFDLQRGPETGTARYAGRAGVFSRARQEPGRQGRDRVTAKALAGRSSPRTEPTGRSKKQPSRRAGRPDFRRRRLPRSTRLDRRRCAGPGEWPHPGRVTAVTRPTAPARAAPAAWRPHTG
ncbi:transposase domain-containing protein [Pseudonocardia kujensis]|nr:transposase domain-containing protein [Pseudonocardia kujensis]